MLQVALDKVDPWGEQRNDERSAAHTAWLIRFLSTAENVPELSTLIDQLKNYLPVHHTDDEDD